MGIGLIGQLFLLYAVGLTVLEDFSFSCNGRLEKQETGIQNTNGNGNRNRNRKRKRNSDLTGNHYLNLI